MLEKQIEVDDKSIIPSADTEVELQNLNEGKKEEVPIKEEVLEVPPVKEAEEIAPSTEVTAEPEAPVTEPKQVEVPEVLKNVQDFVDKYVFNSAIWDSLEEKQKLKAIYNSFRILTSLLPDIYKEVTPETINLDDLVSQMMWIIKRDDSMDRAEQGATGIQVDGMAIYFDSDKTGIQIAPELITKYGLTPTGRRRRVGRYSVPRNDTSRTGFYLGTKERFR